MKFKKRKERKEEVIFKKALLSTCDIIGTHGGPSLPLDTCYLYPPPILSDQELKDNLLSKLSDILKARSRGRWLLFSCKSFSRLRMAEEENVKVAVRTRPFNARWIKNKEEKKRLEFWNFREKARNAKLIVAMSGNSTKITNPEVSFDWGREKEIQNQNAYL